MSLAKDNKIANRLRHVDVPLCYMHNEHNMKTFDVENCQSKVMIAKFITTPLASPSLLRETSFSMGHVHLDTIDADNYKHVTSRTPTNANPHFIPTFDKVNGKEQA